MVILDNYKVNLWYRNNNSKQIDDFYPNANLVQLENESKLFQNNAQLNWA